MKKIVVIGATGMLGQPVTQQLIQAGFDVTILARDIEKAAKQFSGVRVLHGDLNDRASLERAFAGNEAVYLSLHVPQGVKPSDWLAEREGLENVIQAAKSTGIGCIGYLSSLVKDYQGQNGFNWWIFDIKHAAIQTLRCSGIPYLVFYPSNFMENLVNGFKMGRKLTTVGTSTVKKYWIAGLDYGLQVANAFKKFEGSKEYVIQGLEGYTDEEAARIFSHHYAPEKLAVGKVPLGLLKFMGIFSEKMRYGSQILEALNNYPEKFQAQQTWTDLGRPTITIEDYAKSF